MELGIGEERTSVTVEAVGATLAHARFVFGHEKFSAALLFGGEFGETSDCEVELGSVAGQGQDELLKGEGDFLGGNFWGAEGFGEKRWVGGIGG